MQKAKIEYEKGEKVTLDCHLNPSELSTSKSVRYASSTAQDSKDEKRQYIGNQQKTTLSMTLYFDTISDYEGKPEEKDVRDAIKKLEALLEVVPEGHTPPIATFSWGAMLFTGTLDSMTVKYTMFSQDGFPVRATANLTLTAVQEKDKSLSLESPDRTKGRTLKQGESIWSLAYAEYDDPALWREIAVANEVTNPRKAAKGIVYKLPAID